MTYGTFTTIKQALEALNIRESVIVSLVNGEVHIFDKADYIDTVKDEWEDELRDELYQDAYDDGYSDGYAEGESDTKDYDDGYSDGFKDGQQVARDLDQSDL